MASIGFKGFVGAVAASALFFSSTGAIAAPSMPAAQQISPWATLSVLSGAAPAAAVCGAAAAAAAAAQPAPTGCVLPVMDAPPPVASAAPPPPAPVPPIAPAGMGYGVSPLLLGLVAIAAGVGLFFLVKNHHHNNGQPNSPA
jgi:hypothetical protein